MAFTGVNYFNPKQISGCSLWLDGADTSSVSMTFSSGKTLSVWKDKSNTGNNFNVTTGPVTQTKDGIYPVVNIGANAVLTSVSQISLTTSSVFFIVCKLGGTTLYSLDTNVFAYVLAFPNILGGDFSIRFSSTGIANANNTANNNDLVGSGGAFYVNGNYSPTSPLTTYVNSYNVIGGTSYTSGTTSISLSTAFYNRYFYGNIAEFIYYTSITSTQRQQVEAYLVQKWGTTTSLPVGHPGLTQTVYGSAYNNKLMFSKNPYYTAFSPKSITNCLIWFDATDSSTFNLTGTTVNSWTSKGSYTGSAAASTGTVVSGTVRQNGLNVVRFAAGTQLAFTMAVPNQARAWFSVTRCTTQLSQATSPSFWGIIDSPSSGAGEEAITGQVFGVPGTSSYTVSLLQPGITDIVKTSTAADSFQVWTIISHVNSAVSTANNIITINGTSQTLVLSSLASGYRTSSYTKIINKASLNSGMDVGEIIMYNGEITATQRQQVESYLAQKWGLVSSLPTGHLNATFPAGSPTAIQPYVASVSPLNLKFIAYPTGTPTVNTPTNTATTLNMTWNAPTFTTSWSARQITQLIITSYTVYVLADGTLATTLTPGNVLSTTYSPMSGGVAYSFYVSATGPGGISAASATSSTVTYILPPGSPTVNTPTNTVNTLNMTWNAPVGGGQVTSYTVFILAAGSLASTLTPGFVTSTTFSPMTGDVAYSFYVSATGPGGTSSASPTSATVTYSAGPMSYITGVNIYSGTTATNWTNNWQPYLNAVFSCNALSNITTTFSKVGISNYVSAGWFLGVTHPDGSIYYAPFNATSGILKFTPSNSSSFIVGTASGVSYAATAKWYTGFLGADTNIYFFPQNAGTILKYIPSTNTASVITIAGTGGTYTAGGYRGGIVGPNGRIYNSPYGATSIFWYDPATNTSGNIATNSSSSIRYEGASLGSDGNIWFTPGSTTTCNILLNTTTYTVSYPTAGNTLGQAWRGGAALAPNGYLYWASPTGANLPVLYNNPAGSSGQIPNTSAVVYRDSFLGPDGKIYAGPNNGSSNVIVVNPNNNTVTNSNNALTVVNTQGGNMGLDGNIYFGTYASSNILKIQFNNVRYPFDCNYILSAYNNHQ